MDPGLRRDDESLISPFRRAFPYARLSVDGRKRMCPWMQHDATKGNETMRGNIKNQSVGVSHATSVLHHRAKSDPTCNAKCAQKCCNSIKKGKNPTVSHS